MEKDYLSVREANSYSPLSLAFLGDSVYDTLVREYLLRKANMPVAKLHSAKIKLVCAEFQSEAYDLVADMLDEHELAVLKRKERYRKHRSETRRGCSVSQSNGDREPFRLSLPYRKK